MLQCVNGGKKPFHNDTYETRQQGNRTEELLIKTFLKELLRLQ